MNQSGNPIDVSIHGDLAQIELDAPPVNALSNRVRAGLSEAFANLTGRSDIKAILLSCRGRTFSVGADIKELGKPRVPPSLPELLLQIEQMDIPVVAVIHGKALGGGLEMALAAHYRIAADNASCGLPEVNIGILPGAGGTQRLPRLIGVAPALDLIMSGQHMPAKKAHELGIFDRLSPEDRLLDEARAFARELVSRNAGVRRIRELTDHIDQARKNASVFDAAEKLVGTKLRGFAAPSAIIQSVKAAVELPFNEGLAVERGCLDRLLLGDQPAALRHVFFAEREALKVPGLAGDIESAELKRVGVIGAGTMGGGIAMNFLNIGIPVTIIDMNDASLERGVSTIERNYQRSQKRGKLSETEVQNRMGRLTQSTAYEQLSGCDLVIEAVFENLSIKKQIFSDLESVCRTNAILATNTSYLDVDEIAESLTHKNRFLGLHFFSPANVMKLLEIVRAKQTDDKTLFTAIKLAKMIKKTAAVVGNGWGFVGNRILQARQREIEQLNLEGASVELCDKIMFEFGFPMGHFQLRDLVGLDVGWDRENSASRSVRELLNEMGRHGQKTSGGYYDYDENRNRTPSPTAEKLIAEFAGKNGVQQRTVSKEEIHDRALFAMVNEGAKILEEGIALRSSDIDLIWVTGYGWPKFRGGPMYWADQVGLSQIVTRLDSFAETHGESLRPTNLLRELAVSGRSLSDWKAQGI